MLKEEFCKSDIYQRPVLSAGTDVYQPRRPLALEDDLRLSEPRNVAHNLSARDRHCSYAALVSWHRNSLGERPRLRLCQAWVPLRRGPISAAIKASLDLSLCNNARIDFVRRDASFTAAFAIDNIIYTEHVVYATAVVKTRSQSIGLLYT